MSLRDLGVFNPLPADHPIVIDGDRCWICNVILPAGMRIGLKACQSTDETNSHTVEARPVCATCFLRGVEINTPKGCRIVDRVKEGNGSPYPVITTDGKQWKDEDVSPVQARRDVRVML